MSKTWSLMAEYYVKADSEEEVWEKWAKEKDVTYDSIWSIELLEDDEDDEEEDDG